jgi:DUF4097 and DUF4098 domain-containing protein YvlB
MRYSVLILALAGAIGLFADTEDQVRRSIPVNSSGRMVLAADWGAIKVQSSANRSAQVEVYFRGNPPSRSAFDRMLADFSLDVSQVGTDIRVNGRFKDGWKLGAFGGSFWDWFSRGNSICRDSKCLEYTWLRQVEYRVSVPREFSVDLSTSGGSIAVGDLKGEVVARTSGGSLTFGRIEGPVRGNTSGGSISLAGGRGKASLHTSGGGISIEEVAGEVDAETSGGSVQVNRATGRVSAHTSGGSITIREAAGALDASTSGGSVSARLSAQPQEASRVSTSGGSINIELAAGVHVDVDASTSGGGISSDFAVPISGDRQNLRAAINGGGPLLQLHTSGGGISIQKR